MRIRACRRYRRSSIIRLRAVRSMASSGTGRRDDLPDGPARRSAGRTAQLAARCKNDHLRREAVQHRPSIFGADRCARDRLDLSIRVGQGLSRGTEMRFRGAPIEACTGSPRAIQFAHLRRHGPAARAQLRSARWSGMDRTEYLPDQSKQRLLVFSWCHVDLPRTQAGFSSSRPVWNVPALHRCLSHLRYRSGGRRLES